MLTVSQTVKNNAPKDALFFRSVLEHVLGEEYDLSLVFIGNSLSRRLNLAHRGIDKPTDILSYPLDKKSGEIFINIPYSQKKCKKFDRNFSNYVKFIFIHGLVHLKGYEHGSRMEHEEKKVRTKFKI
jgi:probable rRNA maturation factor